MFDLRIINGNLVDGTGAPSARLDIGINGDTIDTIGSLAGAESVCTIDAAGKIVCPGFIDAHSHSDAYILIEPSAASKLFQGITTEVTGNCGASAAPLVGAYQMPSDWRDKQYPGSWSSVSEYRELLESLHPAPNIVLLTGHNTLRAGIAGYGNRKLSRSELDKMKTLLEKSMDEGSRGLSTGLIYAPGMYASMAEISELAEVAARYNGVYTSHMRSEGRYLLEAIKEALEIGRESGVRVEISHLKTTGRQNWALLDEALDLIREARNDITVYADRYPYISANTELDVVLPDWAAAGGHASVMARLMNKSERIRIREEMLAARADADWQTITIGSTYHSDNARFQGMPLEQVASELGMHPVDAVLHLIELDTLKTSAFFGGMNEDNMIRILTEPYVMLGTDASLRVPGGPLGLDYPHPRAYGSFPRFMRIMMDSGLMTLEEAVRKTTSMPARQFGLQDRGIIEKGRKADVIIFDPALLRDISDYKDPHRLSQGVEYVIVNGVVTVSESRMTKERGGRFL